MTSGRLPKQYVSCGSTRRSKRTYIGTLKALRQRSQRGRQRLGLSGFPLHPRHICFENRNTVDMRMVGEIRVDFCYTADAVGIVHGVRS